MRFECNFLKQVYYNGSYYRVKAHLLRISGQGIKGCSKVTSDNIAEMKRLVEEVELGLRNFIPKQVPLPKTITNSSNTSIESMGVQFFEPRKKGNINTYTVRLLECFYFGGLPFNLARNPYYVSSYTFAANHNISGYIRPNYNMLRTSLLQQERTNIESLLEPIKSTWREKGLSTMCDGWTNAQRRPLINFLAVTEWTDHAIKNFILNHSMRLAIFHEFVNLKMLAVTETRFASVIVMLRRFKQIKRGLQNMVISDKWASYREDDMGKAQFVKDRILNDFWWDQINYILSFTEPIYKMLQIADTDKPCLHLIYETWVSMIDKVKVAIYRREGKKEDEELSFYSVVHKILIDRWIKAILHFIAWHIL
uniref:DUF659 domain-containing protein n=1 Tax=Ananas comosus var. bracteatus TaxID=296719 RepID=A0A6V7PSE6_ANACO|nr:unnamed protein product [Ananas comosus var. bracteatus]